MTNYYKSIQMNDGRVKAQRPNSKRLVDPVCECNRLREHIEELEAAWASDRRDKDEIRDNNEALEQAFALVMNRLEKLVAAYGNGSDDELRTLLENNDG